LTAPITEIFFQALRRLEVNPISIFQVVLRQNGIDHQEDPSEWCRPVGIRFCWRVPRIQVQFMGTTPPCCLPFLSTRLNYKRTCLSK